jgi:antitoxin HicB
MNDTNKTLSYYMGLPYRIILTRNSVDILDREDWFAKVEELPGCMSQGVTPGGAYHNLKEAMELWIETSLKDGDPIPEPKDETIQQFADSIPRELWLDPLPLEGD